MSAERFVTVFGAYGHTGRFVVDELLRRGWTPILAGRDARKLAAMAGQYPGLQPRVASIDDPVSLDRALHGASAVLNCAGPFFDTAIPVVEAALRARIHYLDTCAEQPTTLALHERCDEAARTARTAIIPAMAFFGGLADLLATAAMSGWSEAGSIDIAMALDRWHPTAGTRITGARNRAPRRIVANGTLEVMPDPAPTRRWNFAAPFGGQEATMLPLSEIVVMSRHLRATTVRSYMNLAAVKDVRDPDTPTPDRSDARGRSSQRFLVEAIVRRGGEARTASAAGQDIYAISAPLLAEALDRLHDGRCRSRGVLAPGEVFDAVDFLGSIADLRIRCGESEAQST